MAMTTDELKKILARGEDIVTEYKKCKDKLSDTVFETVCSFSNRYGGHLVIGVADDGTVLGVSKDAASKLKIDFANLLNNTQKMNPTLYLSLEDAEIDGKTILWTYVPLTSQVQKCAGRIYDRNEDGDYDITDSPILVGDMYSRKSGTFTERRVFSYTTLDDLRLDLIPLVKKLAVSFRSDHPWRHMDNMELFRSAGLYEDKDQKTGVSGFNLAGILLFGKDETIRSCAPGYTTDCLLRKVDTDRYDDRIIVETNLIESYDLIMEFIAKHTEDRFHLIEDQRVSIRTRIAREVVGNLLMRIFERFPRKIDHRKNSTLYGELELGENSRSYHLEKCHSISEESTDCSFLCQSRTRGFTWFGHKEFIQVYENVLRQGA
jgi:ATP-dependent DNA helicase RecG